MDEDSKLKNLIHAQVKTTIVETQMNSIGK